MIIIQLLSSAFQKVSPTRLSSSLQHDIQAAPKLCHMTIPWSRSRRDVFCLYAGRRRNPNVHAMENHNDNWIRVHGCLILYEIADRVVDWLVVSDYQVWNISDDPQDSVTKALSLLFIIELLLSVPRVLLYLWRICLYYINDNRLDESRFLNTLFHEFRESCLAWSFPSVNDCKVLLR